MKSLNNQRDSAVLREHTYCTCSSLFRLHASLMWRRSCRMGTALCCERVF